MNWRGNVHILRNIACIIIATTLSGCVHSSRMQIDYVSQRDDCRDMAERNAAYYTRRNTIQGRLSPQLNAADKNAVLAKIFSDCMFVNGWTVATPAQQQPQPGAQPVPRPPQFASRDDDLEFLTQPSTSTVARGRQAPTATDTQPLPSGANQQGQYRVQPVPNQGAGNIRNQNLQPSPIVRSQEQSFYQPEQYRTQTTPGAAIVPIQTQSSPPARTANQPQSYRTASLNRPASLPNSQNTARNDDLEFLTQPGTQRSTVARGRTVPPRMAPVQPIRQTTAAPVASAPRPVPVPLRQEQSFYQPEQYRTQTLSSNTPIIAGVAAPLPPLQRSLTQREKCMRWHHEQQRLRTARQREDILQQHHQSASRDNDYAAICAQYLQQNTATTRDAVNHYIPNEDPAPSHVRKAINPSFSYNWRTRP